MFLLLFKGGGVKSSRTGGGRGKKFQGWEVSVLEGIFVRGSVPYYMPCKNYS